jgi:hypothetical protein
MTRLAQAAEPYPGYDPPGFFEIVLSAMGIFLATISFVALIAVSFLVYRSIKETNRSRRNDYSQWILQSALFVFATSLVLNMRSIYLFSDSIGLSGGEDTINIYQFQKLAGTFGSLFFSSLVFLYLVTCSIVCRVISNIKTKNAGSGAASEPLAPIEIP